VRSTEYRGLLRSSVTLCFDSVAPCFQAAPRGLEARIREKLADWCGLRTRNAESGRAVLKELLVGPLRFTPDEDEHRQRYRFAGAIRGFGKAPQPIAADSEGPRIIVIRWQGDEEDGQEHS
jgi:hypothetical protein